jgi:hypothetical protein
MLSRCPPGGINDSPAFVRWRLATLGSASARFTGPAGVS